MLDALAELPTPVAVGLLSEVELEALLIELLASTAALEPTVEPAEAWDPPSWIPSAGAPVDVFEEPHDTITSGGAKTTTRAERRWVITASPDTDGSDHRASRAVATPRRSRHKNGYATDPTGQCRRSSHDECRPCTNRTMHPAHTRACSAHK